MSQVSPYCHESGCHSPHYSCTSPMDYNSHHSLHSHIPIHQYTNYTAVTNQPWLSCHTCTSFTHPHISSTLPYTRGEVLFLPRLTFLSVFPVFCFPVFTWTAYILWPFAACLLTLPALWYPLCLLPAPTFALPLLLILSCLRDTCYCLWPLPVWP